MGYRSESGGWMPGISVFKKDRNGVVRVSDSALHPGDDFCARTFVITRKALTQANARMRSLRMLRFIVCSDERLESSGGLENEDSRL